ncbi:ABC transporter ATP-binding protein [Litchfieldella xinjiangensis]|uniref:ABC transporter ATP-binding protein n=1 Tax=Litchfieldella xinjiangensis TaxID=1166948 RepID=UPI0005BA0787|nr:ABC transporter ATP-binding protein [Halomonas xinjiangensis]
MSSTDASLSLRVTQPGPIPLAAQFQCAPGDLLALVGPSGSGKTTLLRAIAGLYRPAEGYISIGDETWLDTQRNICRRPQQRRVGFVFQDYALFPHLTALGNVMAAMGHVPRHQRRDRAREWLARVRLDGLEQRHPAQLSGGQRQRVAVARALAREPRALLLDEPFSAVDQVTRRRLQRELALLRDAIEIPMILVTHDLEEAGALADRLCVLHSGRSLQSGPPESLFRRPASAQVARLLDKHNVFSGRKVMENGRACLAWGPYRLEVERGLEAYREGGALQWYIPPSDVVVHRRGRPSNGERENPVTGVICEFIVLGGMTQVSLGFDHTSETLRFEMSTHGARRNGLAIDVSVDVSLLATGIHLMPSDEG